MAHERCNFSRSTTAIGTLNDNVEENNILLQILMKTLYLTLPSLAIEPFIELRLLPQNQVGLHSFGSTTLGTVVTNFEDS